MNHKEEKAPRGNEEAFQNNICQKLSLPASDIKRLFASHKRSLWPQAVSQEGIILSELSKAFPKSVRLDKLMQLSHSGAVHSNVSTLRKRGWNIVNRIEGSVIRDGIRCKRSEYRLVFEGSES